MFAQIGSRLIIFEVIWHNIVLVIVGGIIAFFFLQAVAVERTKILLTGYANCSLLMFHEWS